MRPAYDDVGTQPDSGRFPLPHQADGVARLLEATGLNVLLGTSALSPASLCEFGWSVRVGKLLDSWLVSREEKVGTQMLNDSEALALGKALSLLVEQRGLGALGKKDYELLLFHHVSTSISMRSDWNYALANKLKVTESRIKTRHCDLSRPFVTSLRTTRLSLA